MTAPAAAAPAVALDPGWLIRLRWCALFGQALTIAAVDRWMHIPLPLTPLSALVGLGVLSNLVLAWRARPGVGVSRPMIGAVLALDVLLLTALLYFTGGPFNPFSFLYLVHIALSAVILPAGATWALAGLALACFGALFLGHVWLALDHSTVELQMGHMRMHLEGMWVAFAVAAGFIAYFVTRIRGALAVRDRELAAARVLAEQHARLASLATLAAGAAHELSTPLSTIATAARELERGLGAGAAADDARLIRGEVERCRRILDQLAADAGAGRGEAAAPIRLDELLRDALAGLPAERIRIAAAPALLARRFAVPGRALAQALRSVVGNALDAAPAPAEVDLACAAGEGQLRIEVSDDGPGMTPAVLARAGEPFFTTKPPGCGMGLGLFLTRTVVEQLGGRLELESRPDRGTRARIALPAKAA